MASEALRRSAAVVLLLLAVLVAWSAPAGAPAVPATASDALTPVPGVPFSALPTTSEGTVEIAPALSPSPGIADLGAFPAASPLTVEVGLAPSDPGALDALLAAMYSPGTPEFHAFRSAASLARDFGASAATVAEASSYFEKFGLSVSPSPDRLLLSVSGPSARIGAAFGTTFEEYRSSNGEWFVSHPTPASLPSIVPWAGALGLGNATSIVPATAPSDLSAAQFVPQASCPGTFAELTPCQMWRAYDMTSLIADGTNGSGIRLGVVDAYSSGEPQSMLSDDLAIFENQTGVAAGKVNFVYPDPDPSTLNSSANLGWNFEDALDLEWARASAPGATIDMTLSPNAGPGLYQAVDWLVAHQSVNVISLSWGEPDVGVYNAYDSPCSSACNASTDGSYGILSPVLAFAAAEGITVVAASGDCGSADGTSGVSTNYPASDPDVTGVGGTALDTDANGTYLSEGAWSGNDTGAHSPGCENQGGSGGGYSPFPRPWWQAGFVGASAHRGVPDVAIDAATPVVIILEGTSSAVEGTSVGTPVWAGIAAIADQAAGSSLGLLDPSFYAIAAGADYTRDFHDIPTGNNGYPAGPGWDPLTGLGSPRVANLVADLSGTLPRTTSEPLPFVYATPRYGPAPLTVTFHVGVTGGTGKYPLEGVSFGDGNASFAPGGNATYIYPVPGVYSAQAYVADSAANYSVSPPVAIVVGGGTGLTVTLAASAQAPGVGAPVLFSAGVNGGTAPYEYNFSFGDGTFLDGSRSANVSHAFGAAGSFCASVVVGDSATPPDGGASSRIAIGVGGAPRPDCGNDTLPLSMTATPDVGVRDAPADFPGLFSVSGGSTAPGTLPPSVQYSSRDPYLSACGCAIFRSPGNYTVRGYGNDSEDEGATATTNVTVAPALLANFSAGPMYGPAPLTVSFHVNASGGYFADPARTNWSSGNGAYTTGMSASFTYTRPGWFLAVGHLSDRGDGNASEAFLIDVLASTAPAVPVIIATIRPAVDVAFGATVNLSARSFDADGTPIPSTFRWDLSPGSGAYRPTFNWTLCVPFPGLGNRTLVANLTATPLATGVPLETSFSLVNFSALEPGGFAPRVDALDFSDTGGPDIGVAPLSWWGNATVSAPGTFGVLWYFGDGSWTADTHAQYFFNPGTYTVLVDAQDSWNDVAYDDHAVEVRGSVTLNASISATQGAAPFTIEFRANVSGGLGPPYQFVWDFGDNESAATANGTHTFENPGNFEVFLTVLDAGRDSVARTWSVTVLPGPATNGFPAVVLLVLGAGTGAVLAVVLGRRRSLGGTAIP